MEDFFIQYGYWGMFLAAFLAGSFIPFSSEAVMGALLIATDMDPVLTVASGTAGNFLGSLVNYGIGRLGNVERLRQWLKIKPRRMEQAQRWATRRGAWLGFFAFLPILGTAICLVLGVMRANVLIFCLTMLTGKILRYIIVAASVLAFV